MPARDVGVLRDHAARMVHRAPEVDRPGWASIVAETTAYLDDLDGLPPVQDGPGLFEMAAGDATPEQGSR